MIGSLITTLPLWAVFLVTVIVISMFTEAGYRLGVYRSNRPDFDDEARISAMTAAHLGLLAFILAFSFNVAANHHSIRKHLILEEINAIETANLRADLVAAEFGQPVKELLRDYVGIRAKGIRSTEDRFLLIDETAAMHFKIWQQIDMLADVPGFGPREALLVDAINAVFDIHEERVFAAINQRVPASIWGMLYAILNLSMFGMGYFSGMKGRRSSVARGALTLSLAMILFLIADLDRPIGGLVKADQTLLKQYHLKMQAGPPSL